MYDIRAGIDDRGLMAKYEVTKRQLKGLLKQLADAGVLGPLHKLALELSSRDLIRDIHTGLDLADLKEKYAVTAEEIHGVCQVFLRMGLLDPYALETGQLWLAEFVPESKAPEHTRPREAVAALSKRNEPASVLFSYFADSVLRKLRTNADEVARLLEQGMDPNARDRHLRRPALIWAAGYGNIAAVSMLVDKGADLHATGKDARTALHFATSKNHAAVRELLLNRGAKC